MFHKIRRVDAVDKYRLKVEFADDVIKEYDMKPLLDSAAGFSLLKENHELFYDVQVDTGGYGVIWNDDLDISCDELWEKGAITE